jgi:cytochrome P450
MGVFKKLFKKKKPPPTALERLSKYAGKAYNMAEESASFCNDKFQALQLDKKFLALLQSFLGVLQLFEDCVKSTCAYLRLIVLSLIKTLSQNVNRSASYITQLCQKAGITQTHIFCSVACFTLLVALHAFQNKKRRERLKRLYGDSSFPPMAPFSMLQTGSAMTLGNSNNFFLRSAAKVGPIFRISVPFMRSAPMLVAVGDLETAKEILQDETTIKPEAMYASVAAIAGHRKNIITSAGSSWRHARKGISPAFAKHYVDRMHKICKDKTEEWIEKKLEPSMYAGESLDISKEFLFLTLSIICKVAFEYNIKDKEAYRVMSDLEITTQEFAHDQAKSPVRRIFGLLIPSVRRASQARNRVHKFAKKLLDGHRKKPLHMRSSAETIISRIDKSHSYRNDKDRIADMVMFLFAGHDTTAYSLAWIFIELARNREVSEKLYKALNGNDDTLAQGLLKDVVREGMRLNPVYQGVGIRTAGRDLYIKKENMALVIPKGSQIIFPSIITTRYGVPDAQKFQPERWNDHPNKSFLMFSSGSHKCMGQSLALAEITWVLSRLCAQYQFELVDEGRPKYNVFWKCEGAKLIVQPAKEKHKEESHHRLQAAQ